MSMVMWPRARRPSSRMSGFARAVGAAGAGRATAAADESGVIEALCYTSPGPHPARSPGGERVGGASGSDPEGVESGDIAAHDQGVDIVGALVRVHRLQIHHVPDDRV